MSSARRSAFDRVIYLRQEHGSDHHDERDDREERNGSGEKTEKSFHGRFAGGCVAGWLAEMFCKRLFDPVAAEVGHGCFLRCGQLFEFAVGAVGKKYD